ncbi:MAG: polysulfide reductase NrfD, partial [Desulfobacterales bacterium]|nr:polysulfide reductase NrfD [Desulfobacterales bacterium]
MLETVFNAKPRFWGLVVVLLGMIGVGAIAYLVQLDQGLTVTGMSRDVSWAFYIAQFTYMVGVAAAGVMVVLPYYFHHYKKFKNMIILAEFQAIAACIVCMLFIVVDLGQPARVMNVILHPTPNSMLFYDMIVLNGYLFLNLLVGWYTLEASRKGIEPGKWIKPFSYISVVWAFSIHTVTAFLYQGLPGRHFWLTAILAPRFLASAFCSGPAILMLFTLIIEKFTDFRAGEEAKRTLAKI